MDGDTDKVKFFVVDRLVDKRIAKRGVEYLLRWKGYGSEWDEWRNLSELENVIDLIDDYENAMKAIVFLLNRHLSNSRKTSTTSHVGPLALVPSGQRFAVVIPPKPLPEQDFSPHSLPEQDHIVSSSEQALVLRKPSSSPRRSSRLRKSSYR